MVNSSPVNLLCPTVTCSGRGEGDSILGKMGRFRGSSINCSDDSVRDYINLEEGSSQIILPSVNSQSFVRCCQNEHYERPRLSNAGEKCYRACSNGYSRILQPSFYGSKTRREMAPCHRPVSIEQTFGDTTLSNGDCAVDPFLSSSRGMDNQRRHVGCLLSSCNPKETSEVLPIRHRRQGLPVPGNVLRSGNSSTGIYQNKQGVQSHCNEFGFTDKPVLRRLVESKSQSTSSPRVDYTLNPSHDFSRLHSEFREVKSDSLSGIRLPWRPLQSSERSSFSYPEKDRQNSVGLSVVSTASKANSEDVDVPDWSSPIHLQTGEVRQTKNSSPTMVSEFLLEPISTIFFGNSASSVSSIPTSVVERHKGFVSRCATTSTQTTGASVYRCLQPRLGSPLSRGGNPGILDNTGSSASHKFSGVKSSLVCDSSLSSAVAKQSCPNPLRQLHGSGLSGETRGNKSVGKFQHGLADFNDGIQSSDKSSDQTHSWGVECSSRSFVSKGTSHSHRVEPTSTGISSDLQTNVDSSHRSLCRKSKRKTPTLHKPHTRSSSMGDRRSELQLDRVRPICFPSNKTDKPDFEESEGRTMSSTFDSSGMAKSSLVPRSSRPDSRRSSTTSSLVQTPSATRESSPLRLQCDNEESSRLGGRYKTLQSGGFSKSLAARISHPQRDSTRRVYQSRIRVFVAWAEDNEVDPSCPSIPQLASFLEFLFVEKKLNPRSIRGYKSALTDYFSPLVVDISGSDELSRLLTSFFNERPPVVSSILPWDLRLVLDCLTKSPFEPLALASLKLLSLKTVFLVALASGSRRSELHALEFKSFKRSKQDGMEFVSFSPLLGFLAKNQAPTDSGSRTITIPSLKNFLGPDLRDTSDRSLCPVRSLKYYIEATKNMREGKTRLFISFKPNKQGDICAITISSWLRNVIQLAYQSNMSDVPSGVKPHQVRSASSSWSLKGGVSLSHLMGACFWKGHNTFTSFYLKDCWSNSDNNYSLGPIVTAGSLGKAS